MNLTSLLKPGLLAAALIITAPCFARAEPQVLVSVGGLQVTSDELESALASSPFADRFPGMEETDQAALRGDMLQRLVASRLMTLEAKRLALDKSPEYLDELESFRLGLLYRHYLDKLRERITVPPDVLVEMRSQFQGDADGLAAARSAYLADRYRSLRFHTLQKLREEYRIRLHEERIQAEAMPPETLLLEGDGLRIRYGDLIRHRAQPPGDPEWIREQLYKRAELLTLAKAAEEAGVDLSERLDRFAAERLPALLMERKQREWVADEGKLKAFYDANPRIGRIEERRHIGQLVCASREEAEALRQRILAGESLFELAARYSIDPYGREHRGDMGWQQEGRGHPAIEQALSGLEDNRVSEVVETPLGFHLITILERRPGGQKHYEGIRDRVRQLWISEQMTGYMNELAQRYRVVWHLVSKQAIPATP